MDHERTRAPRIALALIVLVASLSGCGDASADRCAVEAIVDAVFYCAPTADATRSRDGVVTVRARAGGSLESSSEEIRLVFPAPETNEGSALRFTWDDPAVVGAFDVIAPASAFGIVPPVGGPDPLRTDRHEARVGERVSADGLEVHVAADGGLRGRFAFIAYGRTDAGERIPVEAGRFRVRAERIE